MEVDKEFRKFKLSKEQKLTIASMVLTNSALNLWTHLAIHHKVSKMWKDMKRIFRKECVPEYYADYLLAKLNSLKQGDNSIETYYLKDRRRRPEGGEWEPIKITHSNLAYIPNLKIRHALSLGENGQVLSLGQNGQDLTLGKTEQVLTLGKTGQVLNPGKNWQVLSLGKNGQNGQANSDKFSALVKTDKFSALVKMGKTDKQIRTSSQPW
jgi:hypothetical protein